MCDHYPRDFLTHIGAHLPAPEICGETGYYYLASQALTPEKCGVTGKNLGITLNHYYAKDYAKSLLA